MRRQTVAVLFVDIVGFTTMSETMPPEAMMMMLREYHALLTSEIVACDGTVEKYIGDEIFAVFGVPVRGDRDAENALRCAMRMLDALGRWNDDRAARGGSRGVAIGIGLNYGHGGSGRRRQLARHVVHRDRRHGQYGELATGPDARTDDALVVSDALVRAVKATLDPDAPALLGQLQDRGEQALRGRAEPVKVWALGTD